MGRSMTRTTTQILIATLLVVSTATVGVVGSAAGHVATASEPEVADGHTGSVDSGRENDEKQQYPLNYTYIPHSRQPDQDSVTVSHFAEGLTENIRLHYIVVKSEAFNFEECTSTDTRAFGIDRGNDDPGTKTDESLLKSYKSYETTKDRIIVHYYEQDSLAGSPVNITVQDQIVAEQADCYKNPKQKGWYRISGKVNGSTKMDSKADYTIQAGTQWIYICDCDSRAEAKEKLGPPPNADGGGSDATSTRTATPASTSGGSTATGQSTPTATDSGSSQSTATDQEADSNSTDTQATNGTPVGTTAAAGDKPAGTTPTPTGGGGPGFGVAVAMTSLLAAAVLALRR